MSELCMWCEEEKARTIKTSVYWELPDGSRAIEIQEVPSFYCDGCQATYQTDERVRDIENHLFIIDTKKLEDVLTFDELMAKPKLLKRNYFDFSS